MKSLEAEYSFLAPTWKLPSVATTSMYPRNYGPSYLTSASDFGPDWSLWNNTIYNSRYIPPYGAPTIGRPNYPISTNYQRQGPIIIPYSQHNFLTQGDRSVLSGPPYYQPGNNQRNNNNHSDDSLNLTISVHPNSEYDTDNDLSKYSQLKHETMNRGLTYATNNQNNRYPPAQKRRVQIVDHHRQTPSTVVNDIISERTSHNSNKVLSYSHYNRTPDPHQSQQKSKLSVPNKYHNRVDDKNVSHSGNNFNVHEYLYGLATPEPGSYANTFKHHQRRLQDEKAGRKSVMSEYKTFAQNGGFGPAFGNAERQTHKEKTDNEKKKKTYSKIVRETNQYRIEEKRSSQNNNGLQKNRNEPIPKYQRAREYADQIEKPHHLRPVIRLRDPVSGNVIIRDAPRQLPQHVVA